MNFCTLFDSYYIHKGLALYKSLEKCESEFKMYVMAFDRESYNKLKELNLSKMIVEYLEDFETPELLRVKEDRTKAEYCWTCGSSIIRYFIDKYNLSDCTYLDADLMFIESPKVIFDEIGDSSIAISKHFHDDDREGVFCVQFVYFKNDNYGNIALNWWIERCIEWCYSRYEDGKYGDQKYLDQFPILFNNVHIIENRGVGVAPWNMYKYKYFNNKFLYKDKEYSTVFFHFHGTSFILKKMNLSLKPITYDVSNELKKIYFIPYLKLMKDVYISFLGLEVNNIKVIDRSIIKVIYSFFKRIFKDNKIARYLYFTLLKKKYNGYENKKC